MATLTIKNLPDDLYARLKERAAGNRRSLNAEAILCLERMLDSEPGPSPAERLAELKAVREKVRGVYVTDAGLRAARRSGRT
jgi:plasmid stability protein